MIDAIAQVNSVQAPELRLAGSLAPALRARLNGMPGMQRTRHLGWLDQAQLAEEMAQARAGLVLLHPTNNYLVIRPNKMFEYIDRQRVVKGQSEAVRVKHGGGLSNKTNTK